MADKYLKNIAIVGAGGRSGKFIVEALINKGQHRVTAITRPDSSNTMPAGLDEVKHVDYNDHGSLVNALRGQEMLIITMNVFAPPESQTQLIDAAVEAGVGWVIPNEWGVDLSKEDLGKDTMLGERLLKMRRYIEKVGAGKLRWIGIACSFWYEFSLAGSEARYGFDFEKKRVTFIDDGNTKINTTTFAQVAQAVANLVALRIHPDDRSDSSPSLSQFANRSVYVSSFFVSQRDMLASVLRVTGERETEWDISYEPSQERFARGVRMLKEGSAAGHVLLLYTRVFYPDRSGDFNDKLDNDALELSKESLDTATKLAVQMALAGGTNMPWVK